MRKFLGFIVIFCITICSVCFTGCKKDTLTPFVSELRENVYECETEDGLKLKAFYGFREEPYSANGKIGEKVYAITFKLSGNVNQTTTYAVKLSLDGLETKKNFESSAITGVLTLKIETESFSYKEFDALLFIGAESKSVTLKSIVPENTIDYKTALIKLEENQPLLISSKKDENGNFTAEIYMRIIVKKGAPYWYVGICENANIKALLLDGFSGKVLAIKDVF